MKGSWPPQWLLCAGGKPHHGKNSNWPKGRVAKLLPALSSPKVQGVIGTTLNSMDPHLLKGSLGGYGSQV